MVDKNNPQGVSIRPSSFSEDTPVKDYGLVSGDYRITGKISLHPFKKVIKRLARGSGIVGIEKEMTLDAVLKGWSDEDVVALQRVSEQVDDISLAADNRFVDAELNGTKEYVPEKSDLGYINIRVWNESVKNDLSAQAVWAGMSANLYIQARIFEKVLQNLEYGRIKHHQVIDWGSSEAPMRDVVKDFRDWLKFRRIILEYLVEKYGTSPLLGEANPDHLTTKWSVNTKE